MIPLPVKQINVFSSLIMASCLAKMENAAVDDYVEQAAILSCGSSL